MNISKQTVLGQPSWQAASSEVEFFITEMGGHLGPATFFRRRRRWQPFAVAPWAEEGNLAEQPSILRALRGDFFCMPFGGNATPHRRERHPIHGDTANEPWALEAIETQGERTVAHLCLETRVRAGRVDKQIALVRGHNALYCRHVISGMTGPMCLGHHAMLRFPEPAESGRLSTSRFVLGQVAPLPTEQPEQRGYSLLVPGAEFDSLKRVPTVTGQTTDLSRYPARRGYEDIAMIVSDVEVPFAWTAVTFPGEGCVWFALKDPRVLRQTVFWLSNGGRHYPPWNGRHVNVMGLEEVTAYFHYGLAESVQPNPISARGFPTCVTLEAQRPLTVNYIMGAAEVSDGFDRVVAIEPVREGNAVTLRSGSGRSKTVPLDVGFLAGS
ncbi:MAG: hypothetical protein FJ387_17055 [Verrucomicrobia bacterium]|nr:hypothetical protein [Verrucomicrobiota bacterium]